MVHFVRPVLTQVFSFAHRCYVLAVPEGAVGVGMWAFCFIHTSFELCDYAYDVVSHIDLKSRERLEKNMSGNTSVNFAH